MTVTGLFVFFVSAFALEINVASAGELSSAVEDKSADRLVVKGVIDARDLKFIAEEMTSLETLDLSGAQIVAYKGGLPCFADVLEYDADVLPMYCFFDKEYTSVALPEGLKYIGEGAFAGCDRLASVTFPASLDSIGKYAFNACKAVSSVFLPEGVEKVAAGAFSRCTALKTADLSALSAECVLDANIFAGCTALESVNLGKSMVKVPAGAFAGCTALQSVAVGEDSALESIGEEAFVSSGIAAFDFASCSKLKVIGRWAFAGTALTDVALPASVETIGEGAFFCNTALQGITLPSAVTEVSDFVLAGCSSLTDVKVGQNTTSIGRYALGNTRMVSLNLPVSLTYMGDRAMENNTSLEAFEVQASVVPELGEDVFEGINQSTVALTVPEESVLLYQAADQWKEFKIVGDVSTVEESIGINDAVRAYFSDHILCVEAGITLTRVNVYEPGGVLLVSCAPASETAHIDMSSMGGSFYIVTVRLENGKMQTIKLIRQ